jgi:hypothetical protein
MLSKMGLQSLGGYTKSGISDACIFRCFQNRRLSTNVFHYSPRNKRSMKRVINHFTKLCAHKHKQQAIIYFHSLQKARNILSPRITLILRKLTVA